MPKSGLTQRMARNLLQQRTQYLRSLDQIYRRDMWRLYTTIAPHLPEHAETILDVGCGLGGINIHTAKHYPKAALILMDIDGDEGRKDGWATNADQFGRYNELSDTVAYLRSNGVTNQIETITDIPEGMEVDLCYSFLSWGFHYPLATYCIQANTTIIDVRRGTDERLTDHAKVITKGEKHDRYVITNSVCTQNR